jgi:hypothetical protein
VIGNQTLPADCMGVTVACRHRHRRERPSRLLRRSNVLRVEAVRAAAAEVDSMPIIQDVW